MFPYKGLLPRRRHRPSGRPLRSSLATLWQLHTRGSVFHHLRPQWFEAMRCTTFLPNRDFHWSGARVLFAPNHFRPLTHVTDLPSPFLYLSRLRCHFLRSPKSGLKEVATPPPHTHTHTHTRTHTRFRHFSGGSSSSPSTTPIISAFILDDASSAGVLPPDRFRFCRGLRPLDASPPRRLSLSSSTYRSS